MDSNTKIPVCMHNQPCKKLAVKKDGPNKGRDFWVCSYQLKDVQCAFFMWADLKSGYDFKRFKPGSCYRCGRYGCEPEDCKETRDFYGFEIPEQWIES